jgi:aspartyl-tRNA(Asn)/glutamyl-tRNA(Gln) amidotransferase subunit C
MKHKDDTQLIYHIAELAQVPINDEKVAVYQEQLEMILDHFGELESLSLEEVSETSRVIEETNIWREDDVQKSFSQEEALQSASETHEGYHVVQFVLTGKDAT